MAKVGSLSVDLALESAQFIAGLKQAAAATTQTATQISSAMNVAKNAAIGFAGGFIGAFSIDVISQRIQEAFDFGDAIVDLADRTGATTKTIQELRYAAQMTGSSFESSDAAIEKFAKNLGAAQNGNKAMQATFKELGVTSRDTDTAIKQTMDGISKLGTVTQRNQKTIELFGKSAGDLTALMGDGTSGFNELAAAAQSYGIVLEDGMLRNGGQVNDQLDTMKMIVNAQMAGAIIQNADAIMSLANSLIAAASAAAQFFASFDTNALASVQQGNWTKWDIPTIVKGVRDGKSIDQTRADAREQLWKSHGGRQALFKSNADRYNEAYRSGRRLATDPEMQQLRADNIALVRADRAARAAMARGAPPPPPVAGTLPTPAGGKTKTPKAKHGPTLKTDEDLAAQWERAQSIAQDELLRAREGLTNDPITRQSLQTEQLQNRLTRNQSDITMDTGTDAEVREGKKRYTAAQAQILRELEVEIYEAQLRATLNDRDADMSQDRLDLALNGKRIEAETLSAQSNLARSVVERRTKSLELVRNQFEQERLQLAQTIELEKLGKATKAEREAAEARLKALPALQSLAEEGVKRQNQTPMEAYLDQIPRTKDQINEALENVEVEGLNSLQEGLMGVIDGTKSVGDAFTDMSKSIINGLIKIGLQQAIIKPLGNLLFGGGDGGGGGFLTSIFGSLIKGARANGGMTAPGNYLVGERGPEVVRIGANADVMTNRALSSRANGGAAPVTVNFGNITSNDPAMVKLMATQAAMELAPVFREQAVNATMTKLRRPSL